MGRRSYRRENLVRGTRELEGIEIPEEFLDKFGSPENLWLLNNHGCYHKLRVEDTLQRGTQGVRYFRDGETDFVLNIATSKTGTRGIIVPLDSRLVSDSIPENLQFERTGEIEIRNVPHAVYGTNHAQFTPRENANYLEIGWRALYRAFKNAILR